MERIPGYLMIIGTVFCVSLAIGGYALISFTPDNLISRERVCIPPDLPSGALLGYWNIVAEKTAIDPGTAELVRLQSELGTGGTVKKIELEFVAETNGVNRYYVMWYRSEQNQCGWSDGISYPKKDQTLPKSLRVNPTEALRAIEQAQGTDDETLDIPVILETHRFPDPTNEPGQALHEIGFFRNGTPVRLPLPEARPGELLPFSLTITRNTPAA